MNKSNFEFLKGVNDFLYKIALAAEKNYPDDPNTTMSKLRIFGESVAKHLGKALQIQPTENQFDLIRELTKVPAVDESIINVFHVLRKVGNRAVHDYHNDLDDAAMSLRLAFRLSVWYYRLIKNDPDFASPIFKLPSGEQQQNFTQEVTELKAALQKALNTNAQTDAELEDNKNKLVNLNGYISILESNQHESQQQIDDRVATLEAQLKQKDLELAQKNRSRAQSV